MSSTVVVSVAEQINDLHERAEGAYFDGQRRALEYAIQAGGLLAEQKSTLGHGNFGAWCDENLSFSRRRAQEYMQLVEHAPQLAKSADARAFDGTIDAALRQIRTPRPKVTSAPRASSPPTPTPSDAAEQLRRLGGGVATPEVDRRLAEARTRESPWTGVETKRDKIRDRLDAALDDYVTLCAQTSLSRPALSDAIDKQATALAHVVSAMRELAFGLHQ